MTAENQADAEHGRVILRRLLNKLGQLFLLGDEEPEMLFRASGDVICPACGQEYWKHTSHPHAPWLTRICGGFNVKL